MSKEAEIEAKLLDSFAGVASSIGYSDLHGKIIAVLLIEDRPVPLQEIAEKTNYSLSTISLSIDFLEVLGVIKKVRQNSDRKVYVTLASSLFDCLKRAVLVKVDNAVNQALLDFKREKDALTGKDTKIKKTITVLEEEITKLQSLLSLLNNSVEK